MHDGVGGCVTSVGLEKVRTPSFGWVASQQYTMASYLIYRSIFQLVDDLVAVLDDMISKASTASDYNDRNFTNSFNVYLQQRQTWWPPLYCMEKGEICLE